jgi:hypothetical protein
MVRRFIACAAVLLALAGCQQSAATLAPRPSPSPVKLMWRALPAPIPQGYRTVEFDRTRGVFWVLSRELDSLVGHVVLQRFDPVLDAWFATSVALDATGYRKALIQVAPDGGIWLGWGRTLALYDPASDSVESWPLPPDSAGVWSTDGDMVAMLVSSSSEVWIATEPVHAVFGFNPISRRWDRKFALPFEAVDWSRITEPVSGTLLINGTFVRGSTVTSHLARINISKSAVTELPPAASDYVLDRGRLVYVDDSVSVRTFDLSTGADSLVAADVPMARPYAIALDANGGLWFSVGGVRFLGVGRVELKSGAVAKYAFPYIDRPGRRLASPSECAGQFHCVPSDAIAGTQVQSISLDPRGTLWVFTDMGGTTTDFTDVPAPLYEFHPPAS